MISIGASVWQGAQTVMGRVEVATAVSATQVIARADGCLHDLTERPRAGQVPGRSHPDGGDR